MALAGMWDCDRRCSRSCTATPTPRHSQTCHVCCKYASGTRTKDSCVPWPLQPLRAVNSSMRMCLSLDGPALPLVLPRNLLLMQRFLRLPGRRWKSGHPGCRKDGASHRNRSYCRKCYPPHVCCGQQGQQHRHGRGFRSRRARNSLSFNFLCLATHLHLQRSIGGLALGVPPNSHGIGDFDPCDCVWLTGHEEDGCFLSTTINMILPPS